MMKDLRQRAAEEFVRIWQTAKSPADAAKKAGLKTDRVASTRATQLRAKGVPLKKFPRGAGKGVPHNDWSALAKLARSLNGKAKP